MIAQPREHAVRCTTHNVDTWRPDGRCVLCVEAERCAVCGGLNPGDVTHTRCQ